LNQCVWMSKMNSSPERTLQATSSSNIASSGTQNCASASGAAPPAPESRPPPRAPDVVSSDAQPLTALTTQREVAMPIELARKWRRSIPTLRAFSAAFSRTRRRVARSRRVAWRKYSPFDWSPNHSGGS